MATKNLKDIAAEVGLGTIKCTCGRRIHTLKAMAAFFQRIVAECRDGHAVRIMNFGTFEAKLYKGGKVKSPIFDGEQPVFGDALVLRFHQSARAKQELNKDN